MEQLVYLNETVREHSLYRLCPALLNGVSNRDYPGSDYFDTRIECLDMDSYEKKVMHKAQADNTVDAVIGVGTYHNNRAVDARLLLVEFRMGYESTGNLSKTEMERKVVYTKSLLGGEKTVSRQSLFVFSEKVAPMAKNWFDRQQKTGGNFRDCESCSVVDFGRNIKALSDFPYVPVYSEQAIVRSFQRKDGWEYIEQMEFWCEKARELLYKNPLECDHIREVVKKEWENFRNSCRSLSDEEDLAAEILEEDFGWLS